MGIPEHTLKSLLDKWERWGCTAACDLREVPFVMHPHRQTSRDGPRITGGHGRLPEGS